MIPDPGKHAIKLYVEHLEAVALMLWAELSAEQVHTLNAEQPVVVQFMQRLHEAIDHPEPPTLPQE